MLFNVVLAPRVDFDKGLIRCDREFNFLHTPDSKIGFVIIFGDVHVIPLTSLDVDFFPY